MSKCIIIGTGSCAFEFLEWTKASINSGEFMHIKGYVDDGGPSQSVEESYKIPFLGNPSNFQFDNGDRYIVLISNPIQRGEVQSRISKHAPHLKPISFVHPTAVIASTAIIGSGVFIYPNAVISCNSVISDHCIVNSFCGIGHDVIVGSFCTISSHVDLTGFVNLESYVFIGSGARVLPKVVVGEAARIGAGVVVTRNLKAGHVVATTIYKSYKI
jgi:sugar O-acyltransferase (sialic acid O-acetyltransferase NeuD family)